VDDIIVYRVDATTFRMVVNASNHAKDVAWMREQNRAGGFEVQISDETDDTGMIAVQGPNAAEILAGLASDPAALRAAPMFGLNELEIAGVRCFAPRSGYTGEDGFELICPAGEAARLWRALLAAGVAACGLGSRDVLRVEAGLPLYGHELSDALSPMAAGLGWVISKTKRFIGSDHINAVRANGPIRKIQGVKLASKRLITPGMGVFVEGRAVGEVTSGVYSPTLECGIAFVLIDASIALGTACAIEVRGTMEPGTVVNKRFLRG
jgi:aminomethyltransferase